MALTQDCKAIRYGSHGDSHQLTSWPVGANQQLYSGAVALVSGGSGATKGYLKNGAAPTSTDLCVGLVGEPAGGTYVKTGPGILGTSTDGGVWANVLTGTFMFQSSTVTADVLSNSTSGSTVYYAGESASGPVAALTNGGGTRPVLGIQFPQDPGMPGVVGPMFPIKMNVVGSP